MLFHGSRNYFLSELGLMKNIQIVYTYNSSVSRVRIIAVNINEYNGILVSHVYFSPWKNVVKMLYRYKAHCKKCLFSVVSKVIGFQQTLPTIISFDYMKRSRCRISEIRHFQKLSKGLTLKSYIYFQITYQISKTMSNAVNSVTVWSRPLGHVRDRTSAWIERKLEERCKMV